MLTKRQEKREVVENVSLDMLVPADHLLRKIDAAIDFNRIYEFVDDLYCKIMEDRASIRQFCLKL